MKIKKSFPEIVFDIINYTFLFLLMVITAYPLYYVLVASISDPVVVAQSGGMMLIPKQIHFDAYNVVLQNKLLLCAYRNTVWYTVVGTISQVLITAMFAYGLSRKKVFLNKFLMGMIIFTMFFGGGLIPFYLLMKNLGLTQGGFISSTLAMIMPGLVSTWNVIIMKTNFMDIPDSLEESAKLDGANDIKIFFKIIVPLSLPIISVIVLFTAVGFWNSWFGAFIYLRDSKLYPLQLVLRSILIDNRTEDMMLELGSRKGKDMSEVIKYAIIIFATVPILCVYPFIQKYFVTGVRIGAIKG